ncbi:MAG TPA: cellulase family glycosylhydrolase [Actinomycetota bacterium]|nr:cellulase family glycosylhydrolase [Actinomycetota bacterium]
MLAALVATLMLTSMWSGPVSGSTGARAGRITGPLHTKGAKVVDRQGRPVRLLGIDLTQLAPGRGDPASETGSGCTGWSSPEPIVYDNVKKWGFNSVRLTITWANLEPTPPVMLGRFFVHRWNYDYVRAVDRAVSNITSRGMAVIMELSQDRWSPAFDRYPGRPCPGRGLPAWLYEHTRMDTITKAQAAFYADHYKVQEQYAEAWRFVAARYANQPLVVAADMFNEPFISHKAMAPEQMDLWTMYHKIGTAIREEDPDIMLLFQNSIDLGHVADFALQTAPPFDNIVYEFHFYASVWDPEGLEKVHRYERQAKKWGVPLYVGEFNAFRYGNESKPPAKHWKRDTEAMLAYFKAHHISWTYFSYNGGNTIVVPGTHKPLPDLVPVLQGGF